MERRAEAVHGEYVDKARKLDARHCGTVPGTAPGPVEARLLGLGEVQPMVVGHYGEVGAFVDELADLAAEFGARKHWRAMRCRDPEAARESSCRSCGGRGAWPPSARTRALSFAASGA